jgi:hypothetical protein
LGGNRIGRVSNIICQTAFIFLALTLYHLFVGVSDKVNKIMVALVVVSVPVAFGIELLQVAALLTISGANYLNVFSPEQLKAITMMLLTLHHEGIMMMGWFWGLWLLPFGYLVVKSGFIPKFLGYLLMLGCLGYVLESIVSILIPQFNSGMEVVVSVFGISEMLIMLFLLIKGVKKEQLKIDKI